MGIQLLAAEAAASPSLATTLGSQLSFPGEQLPSAVPCHKFFLKKKDPGQCHASDLVGASQPCMRSYFREGFLLLVIASHFSFNIGQTESLLENETEQINMTQFCIKLQN